MLNISKFHPKFYLSIIESKLISFVPNFPHDKGDDCNNNIIEFWTPSSVRNIVHAHKGSSIKLHV